MYLLYFGESYKGEYAVFWAHEEIRFFIPQIEKQNYFFQTNNRLDMQVNILFSFDVSVAALTAKRKPGGRSRTPSPDGRW